MRNRCVEISLITATFDEIKSPSDQKNADAAEGIDDQAPSMSLTAQEVVVGARVEALAAAKA